MGEMGRRLGVLQILYNISLLHELNGFGILLRFSLTNVSTMEILQIIGASILVIAFFGLAVFIHEFGHFLAARLLGFRVDAFAIGFGPALWKRRIGQTEYKVCALPLGGYVALPQLDPTSMDTLQGSNNQTPLPPAPPWKRTLVALAGPLGNVVLAVLLALLIAYTPGVRTGGLDTTLGHVDPTSEAYQAGLREGDQITHVQQTAVSMWDDFALECHLAGQEGEIIRISYLRNGQPLHADVPLKLLYGELRTIDGVAPRGFATIDSVQTNSPAAQAGLQPGDTLLALNNIHLTPRNLSAIVLEQTQTNSILLIRRGAQDLQLQLPPAIEIDGARRIGIVYSNHLLPAWMKHRDPLLQIKGDVNSILRVFKAFFTPKTKGEGARAAKSLGGPVMIIEQLYSSIRRSVFCGLGFLRFLCINLAVINLLPLPVLDGGHILFAIIEMVTRRKLPKRLIERLVGLFAILLIGLMLLLIYKDISRSIRLHRTEQSPAAEATP